MRSVEDHLAAVAELLAPVIERVRGADPDRLSVSAPGLTGRVCAETVTSRIPLPPFDNSQMDGYAVRAEDLADAAPEAPVVLPIGVATAAGDTPQQHLPGTASPVMTGAAVPEGADAIVPVEATSSPEAAARSFPPLSRAGEPLRPAGIAFVTGPEAGAFVRRRGEDLPLGGEVAGEGGRLTPARIGALAAAGVDTVAVRPRLRVLLCTTGDELSGDSSAPSVPADVAAGDPSQQTESLAPGRIHDANSPMLASLLRAAGAEVRTVRCADDADALCGLVAEEAPDTDLVVTSGGISMGAFEVVREAFEPLGASFTGIAMQPGGPQGLGRLSLPGAAVAALCFPGNPVSSLLSAELFLLPTLRSLAGLPAQREAARRPLASDTASPEHKLQLRRCLLEPDGSVAPLPPGSHLLTDLAAADLIAHIPAGVAFAPAGTPVHTWRINV